MSMVAPRSWILEKGGLTRGSGIVNLSSEKRQQICILLRKWNSALQTADGSIAKVEYKGKRTS
jgi:hypothetical protein